MKASQTAVFLETNKQKKPNNSKWLSSDVLFLEV